MDDTDALFAAVSHELIAAAVSRETWRAALQMLGLSPTRWNVAALRRRAEELELPIGHLPRHSLDHISREELTVAALDARTYDEVIRQLGLLPGGTTYRRLEEIATSLGVALPPRNRRGEHARRPIYTVSDDQLRAAFREARSIADLLRRIGLVPKGGNYRVVKTRLASLGLDAAALPGQGWSASKALPSRPPLSELLQKGRAIGGQRLLTRLIEERVFERRCSECRLDSWLGSPIPLELDHINGENDDNRLQNLRLLCPNCHAGTPTYRGRNVARRRRLRLAT